MGLRGVQEGQAGGCRPSQSGEGLVHCLPAVLSSWMPAVCRQRQQETQSVTQWLSPLPLVHTRMKSIFVQLTHRKGKGLAGTVETRSGNYKFKNNYFKFPSTSFLWAAPGSTIYVRRLCQGSKSEHCRAPGGPEPVDFIGPMKAHFSAVLQEQSFILI